MAEPEEIDGIPVSDQLSGTCVLVEKETEVRNKKLKFAGKMIIDLSEIGKNVVVGAAVLNATPRKAKEPITMRSFI